MWSTNAYAAMAVRLGVIGFDHEILSRPPFEPDGELTMILETYIKDFYTHLHQDKVFVSISQEELSRFVKSPPSPLWADQFMLTRPDENWIIFVTIWNDGSISLSADCTYFYSTKWYQHWDKHIIRLLTS